MARGFKGRARYHLKMRDLPRAVRQELAQAAEKNARQVSALQRQTAPRDDGDLRASHKVEPVKVDVIRWRVAAGDEKAFYARMVEFGTPRNAAQPWFYPSYRVLKPRLKARNRAAVKRAIKRIMGR